MCIVQNLFLCKMIDGERYYSLRGTIYEGIAVHSLPITDCHKILSLITKKFHYVKNYGILINNTNDDIKLLCDTVTGMEKGRKL